MIKSIENVIIYKIMKIPFIVFKERCWKCSKWFEGKDLRVVTLLDDYIRDIPIGSRLCWNCFGEKIKKKTKREPYDCEQW